MPYNSYACRQFSNEWGFSIVTSSPHYPKSNGLAEKSVGIVKNILRKTKDVSLGLLQYRNTPIVDINLSPAELLMNRKLRDRIPSLESSLKLNQYKPQYESVKDKIERNRNLAKKYYDRGTHEKEGFEEGETVLIKKEREWVPGVITEKLEQPRSYNVRDGNNVTYRRNSYFLRKSLNTPRLRHCVTDQGDNAIPGSSDVQKKDNHDKSDTTTNRRQVRLPYKFKDYEMY